MVDVILVVIEMVDMMVVVMLVRMSEALVIVMMRMLVVKLKG